MKMHRIPCIQLYWRINQFSFFFMSASEGTEAIYRKLCNKVSSYDASMKNFLSQFLGMTINVILIYILFFSFGVPTVVKYGYPFETNRKTYVCQSFLRIALLQSLKRQMDPFHREFTDLEFSPIAYFS